MLTSQTDIQFVKGVGEKRAKLFKKLGINTVHDLVHFYPIRYIDLGETTDISGARIGEYCYIRAFVEYRPTARRTGNNMVIFKTEATDGKDILHLTIFNNEYLAKSLCQGTEYIFYGKLNFNYGQYELVVSSVENINMLGKLKAVYSQTAGLTTRMISLVMSRVLTQYDIGEDILCEKIREKYGLCGIAYALSHIHFPSCAKDIQVAKRRLMFEELLVLQLSMAQMRNRNRGYTALHIKKDYTDEFEICLPFTLTNAQSNAVSDCIRDMGLNEPMNRLIQGDVGSGKTAVAAAVIYTAVKNGMQAALMAPTGILATQHYNTFLSLFKNTDIKVELIIGSTSAKVKREIKARVKNGQTDLLIGTHTLIQADVEFENLGLVVTDEQHRFGVKQRTTLTSKGENPHTLVMSATPIPRTLALFIYGDLDVSVLDELPPGRQKIETYVVDDSYRERAYNYIKRHLDRGLQGYIVCPMVEENDVMSEVASAKEYAQRLSQGAFKGYTLGLLHGKMKPKEKEKVMSDFADGKIQLLVSTTVIEVGVDVPNAVIMVIENAERFGLSQLHQLRGRVGRGSEKSTCILVSNGGGEQTERRLQIMRKSTNGFEIADEDLKIRGPGDFFGERQHGLPRIKILSTLEDMLLCKQTRSATEQILNDDPKLLSAENAPLKRAVDELFSNNFDMN